MMDGERQKRLAFDHPRLDVFPLEFNRGWDEIVLDLANELDEIAPGWKPLQIKEKFGLLRFYWHHESLSEEVLDRAEDAIQRAEERSAVICEMCGKPGSIRGKSWVMTLCDEHGDKYDKGELRREE